MVKTGFVKYHKSFTILYVELLLDPIKPISIIPSKQHIRNLPKPVNILYLVFNTGSYVRKNRRLRTVAEITSAGNKLELTRIVKSRVLRNGDFNFNLLAEKDSAFVIFISTCIRSLQLKY